MPKPTYKIIPQEAIARHASKTGALAEQMAEALRLAAKTYDDMTTEQFSRGEDRRARYAIRTALEAYEETLKTL